MNPIQKSLEVVTNNLALHDLIERDYAAASKTSFESLAENRRRRAHNKQYLLDDALLIMDHLVRTIAGRSYSDEDLDSLRCEMHNRTVLLYNELEPTEYVTRINIALRPNNRSRMAIRPDQHHDIEEQRGYLYIALGVDDITEYESGEREVTLYENRLFKPGRHHQLEDIAEVGKVLYRLIAARVDKAFNNKTYTWESDKAGMNNDTTVSPGRVMEFIGDCLASKRGMVSFRRGIRFFYEEPSKLAGGNRILTFKPTRA